jgi:hypothetical protein
MPTDTENVRRWRKTGSDWPAVKPAPSSRCRCLKPCLRLTKIHWSAPIIRYDSSMASYSPIRTTHSPSTERLSTRRTRRRRIHCVGRRALVLHRLLSSQTSAHCSRAPRRLIVNGKAHNAARIACARKLLIYANARRLQIKNLHHLTKHLVPIYCRIFVEKPLST